MSSGSREGHGDAGAEADPICATMAAGESPSVRSVYAEAVIPIAPNAPGRMTNRSAQRSADIRGTDMRFGNIHFATYAATFSDTRLGRSRLYLSTHRARRRRANHGIRTRLRGTLAAVQWPSVSTAQRRRHGDRMESSAGGGLGDDTGCSARNPRACARGQSVEGPLRCPRTACLPDPARRNHREARVAAVDRGLTSRHGDAVAGDAPDNCDLAPVLTP